MLNFLTWDVLSTFRIRQNEIIWHYWEIAPSKRVESWFQRFENAGIFTILKRTVQIRDMEQLIKVPAIYRIQFTRCQNLRLSFHPKWCSLLGGCQLLGPCFRTSEQMCIHNSTLWKFHDFLSLRFYVKTLSKMKSDNNVLHLTQVFLLLWNIFA